MGLLRLWSHDATNGIEDNGHGYVGQPDLISVRLLDWMGLYKPTKSPERRHLFGNCRFRIQVK